MRVAFALLLGGCSLVTNFDTRRAAETSDTLCSDGLDNDGDGLADCQDWDCLDKKVCCTLEALVFQDAFDTTCAQAACATPAANCALDPSLWQPWGVPDPVLCAGALHPLKAEQCYDVGALAVTPLTVHPGLSVVTHVEGRPEAAGRLELGLTLQTTVESGSTACVVYQPVNPFVAVRWTRSAGGAQFTAQFEGKDVGSSPELGDGPHELKLAIGPDRKVSFAADGQTFAASDALPAEAVTAHLSLGGRGLTAGFDDVRVTDGTQCDAPGAWQPATPFIALDAVHDLGRSWDAFQVFSPSLARSGGVTQLLYDGCAMGTASNQCSSTTGVGRAILGADGTLSRDPINPVLFDVSRVNGDLSFIDGDPAASMVRGYVTTEDISTMFAAAIQAVTGGGPGSLLVAGNTVLLAGPKGSWDDAQVCCPAAVANNGKVLLYYAGQKQGDPTWRLGLATSSDGMTFERFGAAPILAEGGPDDYDGRGLVDPNVIWDGARSLFRMWYTARASLGVTSIGYAVSADGTSWHKFPGNPVIQAGPLELESLGSPTILLGENGARMWLSGTENGRAGTRIYGLSNFGRPAPP